MYVRICDFCGKVGSRFGTMCLRVILSGKVVVLDEPKTKHNEYAVACNECLLDIEARVQAALTGIMPLVKEFDVHTVEIESGEEKNV